MLDIGGHIGGVAIAFSRMVGETGKIYTFEPNRDIWPHLTKNIAINKAKNITHIPLACFSSDGQLLTFYSSDGFFKADSSIMYEIPNSNAFEVMSISIDRFCEQNKVTPDFMKLDIEGAEIHALRSAENVINLYHPDMIIEYSSAIPLDQNNPLIFLEARDYLFWDVNTYEQICPETYAEQANLLVNILCAHKDSQTAKTYLNLEKVKISESRERTIQLPPGRYIIDVQLECDDQSMKHLMAKTQSEETLIQFSAPGKLIKQHANSCLVISLDKTETVNIEFLQEDLSDYAQGIKNIIIYQINL